MASLPEAGDWQTKCEQISDRGKHVLRTGRWSDCKFIVGTEPHQEVFEGHKLILAMASPVFDAMFYGGIAETSGPIPICDVHPDGFKALLEYIYSDTVLLTSFDQACELCYVAKKYMLPHLVKQCTKFIWGDIRPDNACRAYEFAKLFDEQELLNQSLLVICQQTSTVLNESSFEEVDHNTLDVILQQDQLRIGSEMELFQALEKWAKRACVRRGLPASDGKSMREVLGDLIGKVRYLTMSAPEFAEGPVLSDLLTKEEALAIFVNISSPEGAKRCPMPESFSLSTLSRFNAPRRSEPVVNPAYNVCIHCAMNPTLERLVNSSTSDCTVVFTVSRRVCIVGLQLPTQISDFQSGRDEKYSELLYAHLLDPRGFRLTYTHYTSRVLYDSSIDICFNHIVQVEPNSEYRIGLVLNKPGTYPLMEPVLEATCADNLVFRFPQTGTRDGMISAILYH